MLGLTILEDGRVFWREEREESIFAISFAPGNFTDAEEFLPPKEYGKVKKAWTPKILSAWEEALEKQKELENEMNP